MVLGRHPPTLALFGSDSHGDRLDYNSVESRIMETTRATIGVPISPHDFRRNAATTAAFRAGSEPDLGNGLLQHNGSRTREEHYNRASNLTAAVEFGRMISGLSDKGCQ